MTYIHSGFKLCIIDVRKEKLPLVIVRKVVKAKQRSSTLSNDNKLATVEAVSLFLINATSSPGSLPNSFSINYNSHD